MKTRDFKPGDLDRILEFKRESAKVSFPGVKPDTELIKRSILRAHEKDRDSIKVMEDQGKVVAYVMFRVKETSMGRYGVMHHVFVDEAYRGKGIATKLMKLAEDCFRKDGVKRVRATVTLTNKPSLEMCRKLGYRGKRLILDKELR